MRVLAWLLALGGIAVGMALLGRMNTGYVLVVAPPYRYDLTLNFFLVLLAIGFVLIYVATRIVMRALQLPAEVRAFRERRRRERAHGALNAALQSLLEGRYGRARQHAEKALTLGEGPLSALLAARAAIEVRDFDTAEDLLGKLGSLASALEPARLMMEAEIELARQRPQAALARLAELRRDSGMHTAALRLELRALQAARRWGEVPALVNELKRRDVLDEARAQRLRWHATAEHLAALAAEGSGLGEYWQRLSEEDRRQPRVAAAGARAFLAAGARSAAADAIAQSLEHEWTSELLPLYGDCGGRGDIGLIDRAEGWLALHRDDPTLLLVLGRLCLAEQLWGKARPYLEASLALRESHEAHLALGEMLVGLGRGEEANAHLAAALRLAVEALDASRESPSRDE